MWSATLSLVEVCLDRGGELTEGVGIAAVQKLGQFRSKQVFECGDPLLQPAIPLSFISVCEGEK